VTRVFDPPKSTWGPGAWQNEPDREDFRHLGFPCIALRNHHGAWCGYVGVSAGHPLYGTDYSAVSVDVHGGLTYSAKCHPPISHTPDPGDPEDLWWLGFDCGHAWDVSPGMDAILRLYGIRPPSEQFHELETYRDLEYVRGEIRKLAEQLAATPVDRIQ
jgi:hypothetical protein